MNSLDQNKEKEVNATEATVESTVEVNNTVTPEAVVEQEAAQTQNETEQAVEAEKETGSLDYNTLDRSGLVEALKELLSQDINTIKEDVELIKQTFYKKQKAELEEQKKIFIENGGEEAEFKPEKDNLESDLKNYLAEYKNKKTAQAALIEQEKENNLLQKQHIIQQMKTLTESTDDVSSHINEFKDLQQKWKTIGAVPATMSTDLWKQYNLLQETFWDLVKINNELREYAFKKNLESKIQLCEAAEKLIDEEDIITASRKLQKLHEEWREIGPVSREMREEVWGRFKEATAQINKKHQSHFDGLRQDEEKNQELKVLVCEKIEAIDMSGLNTYNAWDKATQTIMTYQEEWRAIGFAPRKENQKLFERYRKACDEFFAAKAAFYKAVKAEMTENLEKKKALCEQAEAMKDSTDWKETADKFVKIQREWKEVGPVAKKYSDEVWKRFIAACDYFFEQKNKNVSNQRSEEVENLEKKQALIAKIEALEVGTDQSASYATLKELMDEWRNIGHVPFKEKDKIYKAYRTALDKKFDVLNIDANNRRLESFKTNLEDMETKGTQKLYREREKLMRVYDGLKSEIATYENNIGFFSSSSKKADSLLKEMERKIEGLKEEAKLVEQKINMIDDKFPK